MSTASIWKLQIVTHTYSGLLKVRLVGLRLQHFQGIWDEVCGYGSNSPVAAKYHFLLLWVDELLTCTTKNTQKKTLVACVSGGPRIHNAVPEQNVSFTQHSPGLQFLLVKMTQNFFEDLVIFWEQGLFFTSHGLVVMWNTFGFSW